MNELISIIIPVYNTAGYVRGCLESVLNQTYQNTQVIAVDDGSTDGSLQICRDIAARSGGIRVIHQKNQGVSSARNAGLYAACGKYVVFVDSDDFIDPDMCSSLLETAERSNSDLVICGISYFRCQEKPELYSLPSNAADFSLQSFGDAFDGLFEKRLINSPVNKLYKKALIPHIFDEQITLGEDLLFNLDYLKNCGIITTLPRSFYHYRIGSNNTLSSKYRENGFDIALGQYLAVRKFKGSVWDEKSSAAPESYKLISDMCTNAENLARKSRFGREKNDAVLKDYFNRDSVCRAFSSSGYRESLKYRIYKALLQHKHFHLFYRFSRLLSFLQQFHLVLRDKMCSFSPRRRGNEHKLTL